MKDDLKREAYETPTMEVVDIAAENTILTSGGAATPRNRLCRRDGCNGYNYSQWGYGTQG
ncbi:MAG: hypothetical protein E7317_11400 [Clostridiales bacterium]|nr:hypothetical protein [Clostridiales bacterium]